MGWDEVFETSEDWRGEIHLDLFQKNWPEDLAGPEYYLNIDMIYDGYTLKKEDDKC
jgi:hypothetical protein